MARRRSAGRYAGRAQRYPEDAPAYYADSSGAVEAELGPPEFFESFRAEPDYQRSKVRQAIRQDVLYPSLHAKQIFGVRALVQPLYCLRRAVRREVLHAFGIAGGRGIGRSGVRRVASSKWSCK